jgi:hypothetical protein
VHVAGAHVGEVDRAVEGREGLDVVAGVEVAARSISRAMKDAIWSRRTTPPGP